jgi:hypothetical protein
MPQMAWASCGSSHPPASDGDRCLAHADASRGRHSDTLFHLLRRDHPPSLRRFQRMLKEEQDLFRAFIRVDTNAYLLKHIIRVMADVHCLQIMAIFTLRWIPM